MLSETALRGSNGCAPVDFVAHFFGYFVETASGEHVIEHFLRGVLRPENVFVRSESQEDGQPG